MKRRRANLVTGIALFSFAFSIYIYTMFAVKQEVFLDDFEVPYVDPYGKDGYDDDEEK